MDISLLQFNIDWENQEGNYRKVSHLVSLMKPEKNSIICLPELFSTGYTMKASEFQEKPATSKTLTFLREIACAYKIYVIGSLALSGNNREKPTNSAIVIDPQGNLIYRYDKVHLLPLSQEPESYQKGSTVSLFTIQEYRFSVLICYDLRFPEIFRILYHQSVDAIFIIANWPSQRHSHWETLIKARAIENQCYIFAVNRVGKDPFHSYKGGTSIISPQGDVLSALSDEGYLSKNIDMELSRQIVKQLPFRKSRAFDIYKSHLPYQC